MATKGYSSGSGMSWARLNPTQRLLAGIVIVVIMGYLGFALAPFLGLASFWPYAALWAAVGWGGSRPSITAPIILIILGLIVDLTNEAPLGCWAAIHLMAFVVSSLFRQVSLADHSGTMRAIGDAVSFVAAWILAEWLIIAAADGFSAHNTFFRIAFTAALYVVFRFVFRLQPNERLES